MPKNLHGSKRKRDKVLTSQITERHKMARQRRHSTRGHANSRSYGKKINIPSVENQHDKCRTFEDDYKTFKKTKGRRGLSPNPEKRLPESLWVTQTKEHISKITGRSYKTFAPRFGTFPIQELMSKPIRKWR